MKKYIFGFLLIGTFVSYVVYIQMNGGIEQKPSVVVVGNTTTTSPTSTIVPPPFFEDDDVIIPSTPTQPAVTTPPPTQKPVPAPTPSTKPTTKQTYTDGSFTGAVADAYYGNVQVKVIIQNGKITDVQFLDHPQSRGRSIQINTYAMPLLQQEVIQAQSANINTVSGASATSGAFIQSLTSALAQAKI